MNKLIIAAVAIIVVLGGAFFLYKISGKVKSRNLLTTNNNTSSNNSVPTNSATSPTSMTIDSISPSDGQTVTTPSIMLTGKTLPNTDVSINEVDTKADQGGNFSAKISLDDGDNLITIVANDQNGNFVEKEITITYSSTATQ